MSTQFVWVGQRYTAVLGQVLPLGGTEHLEESNRRFL